DPKLAEPQKRTLIRKGLDLLEKAESLKPGYFEAITYRSLLIRQQAMLEKDPEKQKQLIAEADAVRERAVEIIKKRKTAVAQHP
ncbi:MAG TPA: hypothetical protein VI391_06830, partial [Thermoanaerobaculia bacterium]